MSHYTEKLLVPPGKAFWYRLNSSPRDRHKSFTHIEYRAGAVGRES